MEVLSKSVTELSAAELKSLLVEKQKEENAERAQKRQDYETLRDNVVTEMVEKAAEINQIMKTFKSEVRGNLDVMYKLLQEHSSRHADGKGSFSMETSCGTMRVSFKRQDNTRFDERATQAEQHILDFLTSQFGDEAPSSKAIRKLLVRKKGQLEKDDVLRLISMKDDFDNENWHKGIQLLQESIVPGETKYYEKFEMKSSDGQAWVTISLDLARL